jgi:shikimate dehydrogenase
MTAFRTAAPLRGCAVLVGSDMLFEQASACLEFFGFPAATPGHLRSVAKLGD